MELAEICAKSERYIGTEGGGMDQSISFLAEEGTVGSIELFGNINRGKFIGEEGLELPSMLAYEQLFLLDYVIKCSFPTALYHWLIYSVACR